MDASVGQKVDNKLEKYKANFTSGK